MNYYAADNKDGTNSYINCLAKELYTNNFMIMIGMSWHDIHRFCQNNFPYKTFYHGNYF